MSTTEPLVEHIRRHADARFLVSVNPDGLDAIFNVDSRIWIRPLFDHSLHVREYMHRNNIRSDALETAMGFRALYRYLRATRYYGGPLFEYDIRCHFNSPLIGWFLVLGAKDERSSDTRDRHEQIFNES